MAYKPRIEVPGRDYHVVSRGNNRRRIFDDDYDRLIFLLILTAVARKYGWTIVAYCLMDNHYHLIIRLGPAENGLSRGMCALNTGHAVEYNRRHGRCNHLFGKRYWSRMLRDDADLLSNVRYVLLNPVRAGKTTHPRTHVWSSYQATIGLALAIPQLDTNELLRLFARRRATAIKAFEDFCAADRIGPVPRQPP